MSANSPRRLPTQRRGEERVTEILDAVEALSLEIGPDAITTNHIARRAGVNVGTIYHFFSDKYQIYNAALSRVFDEVESAVHEVVELPPGDGDWADSLIDRLLDIWHKHLGTTQLLDSIRSRKEFRAIDDDVSRRLMPVLGAGMQRHYPSLSPSNASTVAYLVYLVITDVLGEVFYIDNQKEADALVRELRTMVRRYLDTPEKE